jgi:3-phenylpropionate/cinnamic acid dioxygenase small subunit
MTDQLKKRLLEEVVIFKGKEEARTGAEALAPDHSPRERYRARALPERGALRRDATLQQQVEEFLFHQAELLDTKNWRAYIELFAEQGIFAEDRPLMTVRMERITHPNAWSQAPVWETSHIVGNVVIEESAEAAIRVRSRFQVQELRRDSVRSFAGSYRHTLLRRGGDFAIELQRVDLMNAQAPFDYTIQAWV